MAKKKPVIPRIQLDRVGKPAEVVARIEALEAEEKKRNPEYKVPEAVKPTIDR